MSRRRGKLSNRRLARALEEEALALVADRYSDFGPTLAREKLVELHGVRVAKETLSQVDDRGWAVGAARAAATEGASAPAPPGVFW